MRCFAPTGMLLALLVFAVVARAGEPATVEGASRVYVREGPGKEFQALGTVPQGEKVEVQELRGAWALVRTSQGQEGYMHGLYLVYGDGRPVLGAAAVPPGKPTPAAAENSSRSDELASRIEEIRGRLDALLERPSAKDELDALRVEVRRLADVTEALRSRLDPSSSEPLTPGLAPGRWSSTALFGVALGALVFGWVVGGAVARRQERSRRSRIRF
ncbi:MAG: hypothetical protein KatS3mg076_1202 [Candidatus Binatia bacterium]|nr:MAG: hypothetical protein KatS3mg076_1202 [Candidatus Binatia bacterium]